MGRRPCDCFKQEANEAGGTTPSLRWSPEIPEQKQVHATLAGQVCWTRWVVPDSDSQIPSTAIAVWRLTKQVGYWWLQVVWCQQQKQSKEKLQNNYSRLLYEPDKWPPGHLVSSYSWQPAHYVLLRLPVPSAKRLTQSSWLAKLKDTSRSPRQILHLVDVDTENLRW